LYSQALRNEDIRTALVVEQDIRKLQGLYVEKIEHSGEMTFIDWYKKMLQQEENKKNEK